jgi:micrococcal nuclease
MAKVARVLRRREPLPELALLGRDLAVFLLLANFFSVPVAFAGQDELSVPFPAAGVVTYVYDGDTVRIRLSDGQEEKVRLIGLDAPELDDKRAQVHFMAEMAKRAAYLALGRRRVRLEYDWQLRDKYGRLLAFIWTDKAGLVNEALIREGFAAVMTAFPFRKDYQDRFRAAERSARAEGKGLWRREPLPAVEENDAARELGRIVRVRFFCRGLRRTESLVILEGEGGRFRAVIPRREAGRFAGLEASRQQRLLASGLVEKSVSGFEVWLFDPDQLTRSRTIE